MAGAQVRVTGLIETRRALEKLDPSLKKVLPRELKEIAEIVARDAARSVPSKTGTAISSIKTSSSATTATIKGGDKHAPYYGWLDFGSREPTTGGTRESGPWRGSGSGPKGGRYIYPAIARNKSKILAAASEAIVKAKRAAGLRS